MIATTLVGLGFMVGCFAFWWLMNESAVFLLLVVIAVVLLISHELGSLITATWRSM